MFASVSYTPAQRWETHLKPSTCNASDLSIFPLNPPLKNCSAGVRAALSQMYAVRPASPAPSTLSAIASAIVRVVRDPRGSL